MSKTIMKCGCAANAVFTHLKGEKIDPPIPACVIHECAEVANSAPDLSGREARCGSCGLTKASDPDRLAFFEYRGPGSREATNICKCGYAKVAHDENRIDCKNGGFEPRGANEFDLFYCGCRGWD